MHVPLLVVAMTDYNKSVPVIVGTNIIRQCKQLSSDAEQAPEAWQMAFHAINNNQVDVVKTTSKVTLQPMEVKTVTGFVRKNQNVESAITEPSEQGSSAKVSVCPRIVSLNNPGKTSRVPVRLFNISAKVVTIPSKSNICELQEVNVLRPVPLGKKETPATEESLCQSTDSI